MSISIWFPGVEGERRPYTHFQAYDHDGDGEAEVAMRTADGTVDGRGLRTTAGTVVGRRPSSFPLSRSRQAISGMLDRASVRVGG